MLVSMAYSTTLELVEEKKDLINAMAEMLLEKEVCGRELVGLLTPEELLLTCAGVDACVSCLAVSHPFQE